ncbi:RsfA family transcriptional regulator [Tepidibacillus decaturensis]|uniref:Precorrin-3B C(17)-methyltransferase n=1 Tax=Tepidibacillus decaturensis TaxID=1413211 RepID=A0A135L4F8_9BACI|nr:RsfA family transcriptional regulator [Tepidibacillus decaturensis]KXG43787.1 precorrin-3B C(17)-methyltransferase [Tepidibacillus decaturensis]
MVATRQDAWTEDDDLLLAEVILRHIREGSTQLKAFEEVGQKLNRTSAACGFRWNSLIRKKYEAAIQIAKSQRQKRNYQKVEKNFDSEFSEVLSAPEEMKEVTEENLTYDSIIRFLKKQKTLSQDRGKLYKNLEKELEEKEKELVKLRKENEEMRSQLKDIQVVNEDYKALIQIMDRARKMAFLSDQEHETKPVFKMDLNGNLERIDK